MTNDARDRRVFPLFMNQAGIFRPTSARRIWDELVVPGRPVEIESMVQLTSEQIAWLEAGARETAYDLFVELKSGRERRVEEERKKALFAMQLRMESIEKIGLENVKRRRKQELLAEKNRMEAEFKHKQAVAPLLKPVFIAFVE